MKIALRNGRKVEATNVDFEVEKENWNEYTLEDGTILKFKTIVSSVIRTGNYDPIGNPVYLVRSTNITRVKALEEMKLLNIEKEKEEGVEVV